MDSQNESASGGFVFFQHAVDGGRPDVQLFGDELHVMVVFFQVAGDDPSIIFPERKIPEF